MTRHDIKVGFTFTGRSVAPCAPEFYAEVISVDTTSVKVLWSDERSVREYGYAQLQIALEDGWWVACEPAFL